MIVFFIKCIRTYQNTFSPDHSKIGKGLPFTGCRFYPSCSEYAVMCLKKYKLKSIPKIIWRILRCNPWNSGGIDKP